VTQKQTEELTGGVSIPKAQRPESQQSNLDALNIRLDDEDHAAIAALPKDQRYVTPPSRPTGTR
jgi:2,5-diketo-D-gluconate reductase B